MYSKFHKIMCIAVMFLSTLLSGKVYAVFIDFNDLNPVYDEEWPCWCDNDLNDQYLDKGVKIHGSWFNGGNGQNYMTVSNSGTFEFIGTLPTYVSFNATSHYGGAVFFDVYGASDFLFTKVGSGWIGGDGGTAPIVNELIEITATEGIRYIGIYDAYNMRIAAQIDNLTFYRASDVPEPGSALLICLGLCILILRRRANRLY
jgi:hypothetical protein